MAGYYTAGTAFAELVKITKIAPMTVLCAMKAIWNLNAIPQRQTALTFAPPALGRNAATGHAMHCTARTALAARETAVLARRPAAMEGANHGSVSYATTAPLTAGLVAAMAIAAACTIACQRIATIAQLIAVFALFCIAVMESATHSTRAL